MNVKIYGAGSIGNHLAHACRGLGWDVLITDLDPAALERTKNEIYPARYGAWDEAIRLAVPAELPKEKWDVVLIGTPPDSHVKLALDSIREDAPRLILIEKPLCGPGLEGAQDLWEAANASGTMVLVGYNSLVGAAAVRAREILAGGAIGSYVGSVGGFYEYWGGIFKAHPWLDGPQDTYLGFSSRGGGASGEHSHGINLWQNFSHAMGLGRVREVYAAMDWVKNAKVDYDRVCNFNVTTDKGFLGLVTQDVITQPSKKTMRFQGTDGFLEWTMNFDAGHDAVVWRGKDGQDHEELIAKTRPDDFRWEAEHMRDLLDGTIALADSPINLERGLDTMLVVAAAHKSDELKAPVTIDYTKGYTPAAVSPLKAPAKVG